jgi:hypothetical protein
MYVWWTEPQQPVAEQPPETHEPPWDTRLLRVNKQPIAICSAAGQLGGVSGVTQVPSITTMSACLTHNPPPSW